MECYESPCGRYAGTQCSECGNWFCGIHCPLHGACVNCADAYSAYCGVPDCNSTGSQTCGNCWKSFCDEHVMDTFNVVKCIRCVDQWEWSQFEQKGACEMGGCFKAREHKCDKCNKTVCEDHSYCYENNFLSDSLYHCDDCKE